MTDVTPYAIAFLLGAMFSWISALFAIWLYKSEVKS